MILIVVPDGWPCSLEDCPPGFFVFQNQLCFKTEYGGAEMQYFNSGGEHFVIRGIEVTPVSALWKEEEE